MRRICFRSVVAANLLHLLTEGEDKGQVKNKTNFIEDKTSTNVLFASASMNNARSIKFHQGSCAPVDAFWPSDFFLAIVFSLPHWSIRTTVHTDLAFDDTIVGCRFLLV